MTMEAEKIAEELARRSGDDQDTLSDAGDGGTGSGMTTPAPTVNGIVPVSSEASLTGMHDLHIYLRTLPLPCLEVVRRYDVDVVSLLMGVFNVCLPAAPEVPPLLHFLPQCPLY